MRFMVVGLGSMGKRRIRCLKALGYQNENIIGFDIRKNRRMEVEQKYGIKTHSNIENAVDIEKPSVFIISVPPIVHHMYMEIAIEKGIHFFVEASVVDTNMDDIKNRLSRTNIIGVPSATLLFHPAIKLVKKIVETNKLGKISNIIYHSGQYLPDWHTYEKVSEFYVSNPESGGCREIVPFELTWITGIFGFPKRVCGNYRKTINIEGAEAIDDTYNLLLDYDDYLATVTIDVVSRYATQKLLINGDKKQLYWDWDYNYIKLFNPVEKGWEEVSHEMTPAETGYNLNIGENMYIDEIKNFIDAIEGKRDFVNSLEKDHKVLKLLYAIEKSDRESVFMSI